MVFLIYLTVLPVCFHTILVYALPTLLDARAEGLSLLIYLTVLPVYFHTILVYALPILLDAPAEGLSLLIYLTVLPVYFHTRLSPYMCTSTMYFPLFSFLSDVMLPQAQVARLVY